MPHHVSVTANEHSGDSLDSIAYPRRRRSYIKRGHFIESSSDYTTTDDNLWSSDSSIVSDSEAPGATSYRKVQHLQAHGYSRNTNTAASVSYYIDDSSSADETEAVMEWTAKGEPYKSAMLLSGTEPVSGGDGGSQSDEIPSPSSLRVRVNIPSGGELAESEGVAESGGLAESERVAESEGLAESAESGGFAESERLGGLGESGGLITSKRLAVSGDDHDTCEIADSLPLVEPIVPACSSEENQCATKSVSDNNDKDRVGDQSGQCSSGANEVGGKCLASLCDFTEKENIVDDLAIDWENWEQKETTCIDMQDASDSIDQNSKDASDSNDENTQDASDSNDQKVQDASDSNHQKVQDATDSNTQDASDSNDENTPDANDRSVSPSLFSTPNQPTIKSSKPHPKEVRVTLSTARLKSFLHATSGEESSRQRKRMRVEKKKTAAPSDISEVPLVSLKMSNPGQRLPVTIEEDGSMGSKDISSSPKLSSSPAKAIAAIVDQSVLCTLRQHGEQAKDRDLSDTPITGTTCTANGNRGVGVTPSPLSSVDAALIDAAESPVIQINKKRALVSYSLYPSIEKSPKKRRGRPPKNKTLPPVSPHSLALGKRKRGKKAVQDFSFPPQNIPSAEIRRHRTPSRESDAQMSAIHLPPKRRSRPTKYKEPDFISLKLPSTVLTPTITDEDVSMEMSESAQEESLGGKNVICENIPISSQDRDLGFHPINVVDVTTDSAAECEEMATVHFPLINTKVMQTMPNLSEQMYSVQTFSSPEIPLLSHQTLTQREAMKISSAPGTSVRTEAKSVAHGTLGDLTKLNSDVLKDVLTVCDPGVLKQLHGILTDLVMQHPSETAELAQNSENKGVSLTAELVSSPSSSAQVVVSAEEQEEEGQELEVVSDSTADTDTEYSGHLKTSYLHELSKLSLSKHTNK